MAGFPCKALDNPQVQVDNRLVQVDNRAVLVPGSQTAVEAEIQAFVLDAEPEVVAVEVVLADLQACK